MIRLLFRFSSIALCAAVVAYVAPARAEIEDLLRATQDGENVQVILKLRQAEVALRRETGDPFSTGQQRRVVEDAMRGLEPVLRELGVGIDASFATLPFVGVTVDRAQMIKLLERGEVAGVYMNIKERKSQVERAALSDLERAQLASSVPSVDVADAWNKGYDGRNTTIAVIDGGFRTSHPMFAGKVVAEACFSANDPTFDTFTQCPSGQTPEIAAGAASKCPAGSTRCNHGTHVASIAVGNDGTNFGVARAANLLPIDVFSEVRSTTDCSPDPSPCELTDSLSVLKALDYVNQVAVQFNIVAVNLSLGGSSREGFCDTDPRRETIEMLRAKGVAVAAATGNGSLTGRINAPSCIAAAVAVGAVNDGIAVASFSNVSTATDLMAPGVSIRAASGQDDGFRTLQGTSMAAPHAAGAFAVIKSALPTKTVDEIESALKATGLKTTRTDSGIVVPKIQVTKAILRLLGRDKRNFNNVLSSNSAATLGQAFLRFQNDSAIAGNVTINLRDADSGQVVGAWTSPNIAPKASLQFDIGKLETEARATLQNTPVATNTRAFFNVEVESTVPGYMQHIVWARGAGVLTNLTACADGLSDDGRTLLNVHSRAVDGYPSRLRIANTGTAAESAVLTFFNSANGKQIGTYTTSAIPPNGSLEVTLARIEAAVPGLQDSTVTGSNLVYQYNVRLDGLTGYAQHIVENTRTGVLLDLSPKCDLGVRQ
jgi:subtilisin family serine protease